MQRMDDKGFHMTYFKITFLLITLSINATADSRTPVEVSEPPHENQLFSSVSTFFAETSQFFTQLFNEWFNQAPSSENEPHQPTSVITTDDPKVDINERISNLEKRRLEIEAKRLAAEEKRLAAAEKRLAAAEKRLAAEEIRLASEEKKLIAKENAKPKSIASTQLQSKVDAVTQKKSESKLAQSETNTKIEKQLPLPLVNKPAKKEKKKLQSVVSTTKNAAFIKLENQYYLDLYKWELKTEIYRLVKYPDWAKTLGKTGKVSLDFTINRNAQVSDVSGDNSHISIQLVSELHRAIMFAAKRVLPPDALPGDNWTMSITYNFQPHDVEQVALQKPVKPLFLEREHSTVLIDSDNNLERYQENVQDIISDRIEYPVWAEKLKQRGKVSFEIVINQDGSIADIKPKDVNRHVFLNQEVLRAINDSAPLPSIPEHLRLQSTNMVIQHEFKRQ